MFIEVIDADCSYDHSFLCTGSADKTIMYMDVKTAKAVRKYRAHIGRVNCVRFNHDESNLIISGYISVEIFKFSLRKL